MNENLLIALGKSMLHNKIAAMNPHIARELWLEAGRFIWDIYQGKKNAHDASTEMLANCCSETNGQCCPLCAILFSIKYSKKQIAETVLSALINILNECQHDPNDLADITAINVDLSNDQRRQLIDTRICEALAIYFPNKANTSLKELCISAVAANKFTYGDKIYCHGMDLLLFKSYPCLLNAPDKLVMNKLSDFLKTYEPTQDELIIINKLHDCVLDSKNLYNDILHVLKETNYKTYSKDMKNDLTKPLLALMKKKADKLIDAKTFKLEVKKILVNYPYKCTESIYIKKIIKIIAEAGEKKCDIALEELLQNTKLANRAVTTVQRNIIQPLEAIMVECNQLLEAKDYMLAKKH